MSNKHKMKVVQRAVVGTKTSRRRRRPASASATRARSTSNHRTKSADRYNVVGNTAEDNRLSNNIHAIELHLQRLHEECMYLEAAKVQEELQKLKSQRHAQNTTYWVERHDKTIAGLRQQRENLFSDAQRRMDQQLKQMEDALERDQLDMSERHSFEIKVLRSNLENNELDRNRTERPGSPSQKFSGKVLALLEKEKRLARSRFYERASKARKDAEKLMAIENEGRKLSDYRLRQGKLSRLVISHQEETTALQANFEHSRRRLVAECRTDQKRITVRVRKTRSDLSRARSLRVAMGTSSSPVLKDAATKASSMAEESALTLPMTASPLRKSRGVGNGSGGSGGGSNGSSNNRKITRPRSAHPLTRAIIGNNSSSNKNAFKKNRMRPSTAPSKRGGRSQRSRPSSSEGIVEDRDMGNRKEKSLDGLEREEGNGCIGPEKGEKGSTNTTNNTMTETMLLVKEDEEMNERNSNARNRNRNDENDENEDRNEMNDVEELNVPRRRRRRRRRRPKSASSSSGGWKRRQGGFQKKKLKPCWWCGECDGHIGHSSGVSIPSTSNPNKGTGHFCSWECGSSYVFKYFPIQDRWLSDLLIQDNAGYLVRKSKRPHRRLQGPGIPSINI